MYLCNLCFPGVFGFCELFFYVMQVYSLTNPYAVLLSFSSVISATYANITENVTEKTPDTEIRAKYHLERNTETSKDDFS